MRWSNAFWFAMISSLALLCACGSSESDGDNNMTCGGLLGLQCPATHWCKFANQDCGRADGTGTCEMRPQGCNDIYAPVCGCDLMVYGNSCDAQAAGVDLSSSGGCKAPEETFACGASFCSLTGFYCQRTGSDVADQPDEYVCKDLPSGCGSTPECACLAGVNCGDMCTRDTDGGLTVVCLGG